MRDKHNLQLLRDHGVGAAVPVYITQPPNIDDGILTDQIWSQAGIDVSFDIRPTTYDDSFTLLGDPATITRGLVAI